MPLFKGHRNDVLPMLLHLRKILISNSSSPLISEKITSEQEIRLPFQAVLLNHKMQVGLYIYV